MTYLLVQQLPDATRTCASNAQETGQLHEQKGEIRSKDGVDSAETNKICIRSLEDATHVRYPDSALLHIVEVQDSDSKTKDMTWLTSMIPGKLGSVTARGT